MGNFWKGVVLEHKELIDKIDLDGVRVGVVGGSRSDVDWVRSLGFDVGFYSENVRLFEHPTLRLLWEWCLNNDDVVGYIHTKGVSQPRNIARNFWRRLMNLCILEKYQWCWDLLKSCDCIGVNFCQVGRCKWSHYSGNFWWSKSSWIRNLPDPVEWSKREKPGDWPFPSSWSRLSAEMWLCSSNNVKGGFGWILCRDKPFWEGRVVAKYLSTAIFSRKIPFGFI